LSQGADADHRSRFIVGGAERVYANLAMEEALLRENRGMVLRVWTNEKSVVVGRAQLPRYETDLDQCARMGIPVARRITAGGTVYHGPGNVNWSLFVGRGYSSGVVKYVWGVNELFGMAAELVNHAAASCGVKTWLEEPNRILTDGGKVSGMAGYISKDGVLCHGTFLLSADLEEARRLTEPAKVRLERRYVRSRPMKMANTGIELSSFIASMREAAAEKTGRDLERDNPSERERMAMESLLEKYSSPAWNLGDPFEG
jgi:lipoate-protein ligase A